VRQKRRKEGQEKRNEGQKEKERKERRGIKMRAIRKE
jgi:hypothetical protein